MKIIIITLFFSCNIFASSTLEKRVDELELQNMLNIFKFSAGLKTQSFATSSNSGEKATIHRLQTWLDTYVKASKNLRFYTRFEVFKYMNTVEVKNGPDSSPLYEDFMLPAKANNDRGVNLSRGYFDYIIPNTSLIFSMGRLPTINGPPSHVFDGQPRQSTYPLLSFNGELDGVGASYNWDLNNARITGRLIYAPFSHIRYASDTSIPTAKPTGGFGEKSSVDHAFTGILEFERKNNSRFFPHILGLIQYTKLKNISFEDVSAYVSQGNGNPPYEVKVLEFPDKMADIDFLTIYGEVNNIGGFGLNFNGTFLLTHVFNRKLLRYTYPPTLTDPPTGSSEYYGILNDNKGSMIGGAYLLGVSQNLSFSNKRAPILGIEYLFNADQTMLIGFFGSHDDVTAFYASSGHNYHLYYTQPLHSNFSMRVGYRHQREKYSSVASKATLGSIEPSNDTIRTYYLNFLFKI